MTKAAVSGLTRGLARELGPRGITVNNIAVGPTDTDMNPDDDRGVAEQARKQMPLGRYGRPDEIGDITLQRSRSQAVMRSSAPGCELSVMTTVPLPVSNVVLA